MLPGDVIEEEKEITVNVVWMVEELTFRNQLYLRQFPFGPGSISAVVVGPALLIHVLYPLPTGALVYNQEKAQQLYL